MPITDDDIKRLMDFIYPPYLPDMELGICLDTMLSAIKNNNKKEKTMHKFEDFTVGKKVEHKEFGQGTVILSEISECGRIKVAFGSFSPFNIVSNSIWFYTHHLDYGINKLTLVNEFTPKFKKGDKLRFLGNMILSFDHEYMAYDDSYIGENGKEYVKIHTYSSTGFDCDNFTLVKDRVKLEHHPITEHNIKEVLEYNRQFLLQYDFQVEMVNLPCTYSYFASVNNQAITTTNYEEFINFVNNRIKLKPLPIIPEFDFHAYMLENGFTSEDKKHYTNDKFMHINDETYITDKENADYLIQVANTLSKIKRK